MRGGGKQNVNQFRYATTGRTNMSFGHGKNTCPGRFFASLAVKMVMVKLLTEYDFKSLPGATRPSNLMFHESYLSRHCKRYWSGAKEKECARFSPRYCYNSNFLSHSLLRKPSRVIYDMLGQRTRRERQHQMKMVSRAGQYERTWFYNFLGTDGPSSLTASSCASNRPVGTTR